MVEGLHGRPGAHDVTVVWGLNQEGRPWANTQPCRGSSLAVRSCAPPPANHRRGAMTAKGGLHQEVAVCEGYPGSPIAQSAPGLVRPPPLLFPTTFFTALQVRITQGMKNSKEAHSGFHGVVRCGEVLRGASCGLHVGPCSLHWFWELPMAPRGPSTPLQEK